MKTERMAIVVGIVLIAAGALAPTWSALFPDQASAKTGVDATTMRTSKLDVVPDLRERLAKYRRVEMPFNSGSLSAKEKRLVEKLVDACGLLDDIYWRQSDPEGLALYKSLAGSHDVADEMLRRMLAINGSRFDLIDGHKPFVGNEAMPPGRGFYPNGITREQIEAYVQKYPDRKAAIYSTVTVVKGDPAALTAVPYRIEYREFLEPMAKDLREAADLSDDAAFAKFIRLRADSLLSDDYYASDIAWLDLVNPKFDIVFAPYETYLDSLLGVKGSYGASVMIRNEAESAKLAVYQKFVPELQEALPLAPEDLPSKRGKQTPMEVTDAPFRAGDLLHGYQAVADNLPNDARIHEQKGSKKIFWKNFMDARVNYIILPLAQRVLEPDQAALASGEGYLAATLMHEISHGLGPAFARTPAGKVDIREAIGPAYSGLEEAKADVVGMFGLKWLVDRGALDPKRLNEYYASYVAGNIRTVRFGIAEAHGAAEMMEFNYMLDQHAIRYDAATGRYSIDFAKMPDTISALAKELLEQEATGDRARAEKWFKKYDAMPKELTAALAKTSDIPVDVDPVFSFHPPVR
ncbi:MAG: hypothetical protein WA755_02070 [Candidatus Acidiferrales bacterium]